MERERREVGGAHKKKKTFPRVCYFRDEVLFRKLLFVPVLRSWKGGRGGREGWNCDGDGIYIYISSSDCRLFAKHSELVPLPKHVRLC